MTHRATAAILMLQSPESGGVFTGHGAWKGPSRDCSPGHCDPTCFSTLSNGDLSVVSSARILTHNDFQSHMLEINLPESFRSVSDWIRERKKKCCLQRINDSDSESIFDEMQVPY